MSWSICYLNLEFRHFIYIESKIPQLLDRRTTDALKRKHMDIIYETTVIPRFVEYFEGKENAR